MFYGIIKDGEWARCILTDGGRVWESWAFRNCLNEEREKGMVELESEITGWRFDWRELRGG